MRVLIAGGGIAGLTTAIGLAQRGIASVVCERAARERDQGSGLVMAPNALATLERLGLAERVRQVGVEPRLMMILRSDGTPLQTTATSLWRERYGRGPVAIDRSALHAILLDAASDAEVRHQAGVKTFVDDPGATLRAELEDGAELTGDLLVAADGLRSTVRQQLLGSAPMRYSGQTSWRGIAHHRLGGELADVQAEIWSATRGRRFGFVPIDAQHTYWFATEHTKSGETDESDAAAIAGLDSRLAEFLPAVHALLDATKRLVRTDIFDFAPLRSWHRGRVVLTGDAAHATTPNLGQGACQAIESAYVLAQTLAERPLDAALGAYEAARMARTRWITTMSWRFGQLTNVPGPIGRWLRHSVLPRTPQKTMLAQLDRLFTVDF